MKFSTKDMKKAADYIARSLEYPLYSDREILRAVKKNIALRIEVRLHYIAKNFIDLQEIIIDNDKQNIHFGVFFEDLKKNKQISYPDDEPKLKYVLKAQGIRTRVEKKATLIKNNLNDYNDMLISQSDDYFSEEESEHSDEIAYSHFDRQYSDSEYNSGDNESSEEFKFLHNWRNDSDGYTGDDDINDDTLESVDFEENIFRRASDLGKELRVLSIQHEKILECSDFDDELDITLIQPNPEPIMQCTLGQNDIGQIYDELCNLKAISDHVYLSGSRLLDIVTKEKQSMDLDILISEVDPGVLKTLGYKRDTFNRNKKMYTKKEPHAIDLKIVPYLELYPDSWMMANASKRDFTICKFFASLKLNKDSITINIYDASKMQLASTHAAEKILSLNGNEKEKLEEDPCRIIRAFKYMERGYTPDKPLAVALHNFNHFDLNPIHKSHLYLLTQKLLRNSSELQKQNFIERLSNYDLLTPLFGFAPINSHIRDFFPQRYLELMQEKIGELENLVNDLKVYKVIKKPDELRTNAPIGFSSGFKQMTQHEVLPEIEQQGLNLEESYRSKLLLLKK